jgi:hypothetical protein
MIGGGGAGGNVTSTSGGGGGGAGSCIIALNQTFNAGFYTVKVGKGQSFNSASTKGDNSEIYFNGNILYRANGGGKGDGSAGGCGGGNSVAGGTGGAALNTNIIAGNFVDANTITTTYANLGFKGGDKAATTNFPYVGTGGGGIGRSGDFPDRSTNDVGGDGKYQIRINGTLYNLKDHFANGGVFGDDSYGSIGGGGGAGVKYTSSSGSRIEYFGLAGWGGGKGGNDFSSIGTTYNNASNGKDNTGGGGGGAGADQNYTGTPGNGGHGIVIIRFKRLNNYRYTSSIELINGQSSDANCDWKISNYDGDFKIISSDSSNTDKLVIDSLYGNITAKGYVKGAYVAFHAVASHASAFTGTSSIIKGDATYGWNTILISNSAWNPTSGYFTSPVAGIYIVNVSAWSGGYTTCGYTIRRDATTAIDGVAFGGTASGALNAGLSTQVLINCGVGSTISVWTNNFGCYTIGQYSTISIYLVIAT